MFGIYELFFTEEKGKAMNEFVLGVLACIFVLVFLLTGIELAFAIGITGFVGFAWLSGFDSAGSIVAQDIFDNFTNYGLTVFPLFLLMGYIANNAGIAQRLYGAAPTSLSAGSLVALRWPRLSQLQCSKRCVGQPLRLQHSIFKFRSAGDDKI